MIWLDDIECRIRIPDAVESNPRFFEDGTRIELTGLSKPNLVLKTRYLERPRSGMDRFFENRPRCDIVAIVATEPKPTIILVEAKSGGDSNNYASKRAQDQLSSSLEILSDAIEKCSLNLPFDSLDACETHAVCVMESMRGNRPSNSRQQRFAAEFYRQNHVPLKYIPSDQDIWEAILSNST